MTYIGGAALLNTSSLAYKYGLYPMVDAIAFIIAIILVLFFIKKIRKDKGVTVADLISGSNKNLSILVGVISSLVFILILSAQLVALGKLLTPYFPNFPSELVMFIPSTLIFLYVFIGGFKSVTKTDILQLVFITLFLILPSFWLLLNGSEITNDSNIKVSNFETMPINLIILLSISLIYLPFSQDINIRVKSGKTAKQSKIGLIVGALIYTILLGCTTFIGMALANNGITINDGEQAYSVFFQTFYPKLGILAALAAIISSMDSFALNAITTISNDIISKVSKKSKVSFFIRLSGLIVFVLAIMIALYFNQILSIILAGVILYVSVIGSIALGKYLKVKDNNIFIGSIITISIILFLEIFKIKFDPKAIIYPIIGCCSILVFFFFKKKIIKYENFHRLFK